MGIISEMAEKGISLDSGIGTPRTPQEAWGASRQLWREVFGTNKEERLKPTFPPVRGGSYGRSTTSTDAAYKRLLDAMRSMAPGGWSDDRWEQTKHWEGIQYIAGHRTSEMMAQAEFQVFEKDETHPDGKKPVPRGHPGYRLVELLEKPNPDDNFGDLMYMWNQQMDLTGSSLTWMVPSMLPSNIEGKGTPKELYVIPTAIAIPQPAVNPDFPDGYYRIQPIYPYGPFSSYPTPATAVGAPIPAQWMLRFKYPHPLLRYDGYSPYTALRLHIDEVTMIDRSRHYAMRRQINPSAVLNFDEMEGSQPLPEAEIERIRAEMENEHQGPENVGNLYVATPGAKLEPWGTSPKDMEYQSGWDQLVSFTLGGLGITKPAAGMVEDSSYSTLFATLKQFHLLTLEPKCQRIAAKLTRHLAPFFADDLIVEIRCRRIDDHDVKKGKLNTLMQAMAVTKNEIRKELDMPLTPEPWGNEIAGVPPPPPGMPGQGPVPSVSQQAGPGQPPKDRTGVPGLNGTINPEPLPVVQNRGQPEDLGRGALGPRKDLTLTQKILQRRNKCLPTTNGHHKELELEEIKSQVSEPMVVNVYNTPPVNNVSVYVPETKAGDVIVNVPKRNVTKNIAYDSTGRPIEIKEIEQ